jgi:(p)ppGpp synthase/HD superfamily hydrolase
MRAVKILSEMVAKAIKIAVKAHDGQYRKFEETDTPYIVHPIRVAAAFDAGTPEYIVAILHDVVEDTDVTLDDLREHFPEVIIDGVDGMTRRKDDGETFFEYVERCGKNPVSKAVKAQDLVDNMGSLPESHGLRARYTKAMQMLGLWSQ